MWRGVEALRTLILPQPVMLLIPPPTWGLVVPDQGLYLGEAHPDGEQEGCTLQEEARLRGEIRGSGLCVPLLTTRGRPSLLPNYHIVRVQSLKLRVGLRSPQPWRASRSEQEMAPPSGRSRSWSPGDWPLSN